MTSNYVPFAPGMDNLEHSESLCFENLQVGKDELELCGEGGGMGATGG